MEVLTLLRWFLSSLQEEGFPKLNLDERDTNHNLFPIYTQTELVLRIIDNLLRRGYFWDPIVVSASNEADVLTKLCTTVDKLENSNMLLHWSVGISEPRVSWHQYH